jgi:RimJ/RimL family protein N-acetyltransferase
MSHIYKLIGNFANLRPLRADDAELTLRWRSSKRASMLNAGATTIEEQVDWIISRPSNEYNFVIELSSGTPIGMLSLVGVNSINRHAETARFLIGEEEASRGVPVAVEAMKLIYAFAFDDLKLVRLFGTVASGNSLMVKWQKYLGMKEEGCMRNHFFVDGKWQDAVVLGLLVDEYRIQSLPRMNALISAALRKSEYR